MAVEEKHGKGEEEEEEEEEETVERVHYEYHSTESGKCACRSQSNKVIHT